MNGFTGEIGFQIANERMRRMHAEAARQRAVAKETTTSGTAPVPNRSGRAAFDWSLRAIGLGR